LSKKLKWHSGNIALVVAGGFLGMGGVVDKPHNNSALLEANSRGGKAGTANTSSVCAAPVARKLTLWSSMQVET
jgi:hypothetical protein